MKYAGTWHIVEMDMWDDAYCNMEVQAYIRVGSNGLGDFQFGLIWGQIDGETIQLDNTERFEFTWDGQDECDPVSGSGWLLMTEKNKLKGRIKLHLGDSSNFLATRAEGL